MSRSIRRALLALATLTSGCLPVRSHPTAASAAPALATAAGLTAAVGGPAAAPALQVSVDEAFYPVGGLTAPQLNVELARRGPRHEGARWLGLTDFRVAYSYVPAREPEGCRVAQPRVSVRVVTTLPTWKDRDHAPEPLRADWDLFLDRLRAHEEGHQRIAIVAGETLLEEVAALEASDCEALRRSALALVAARRESVEREQRGWDLETGHGLEGS